MAQLMVISKKEMTFPQRKAVRTENTPRLPHGHVKAKSGRGQSHHQLLKELVCFRK